MKNLLVYFCILITLLFFGCSSSEQVFKPGINLSAYRYIYMPPFQSHDENGVRSFVENLFNRKGLLIVSPQQLKTFKPAQVAQTLVCNLTFNTQYDIMGNANIMCNATVELSDYNTEVIYTGRGMDKSAFTSKGTVLNAFENALNGFISRYKGFDEKLAIDPIQEVKKQFVDWEIINYSENDFKLYLDNNAVRLNPLEGIWTAVDDNQYQIGIIKEINNNRRDYVGFILQSDNPYWDPKQVKMEFKSTAYKSAFTTTYYMGDHSKQGVTSFLKDEGLLEFKIKDEEGKTETVAFIKNYPNNSLSINENNNSEKPTLSSGSGFFISEIGLVATNWHVVDNCKKIEISFPELNISKEATIKIKDVKNDIAILQLKDFNYKSFFPDPITYTIIAPSALKVGEEVFTLGFPLADIMGSKSRLSNGRITSLFGIQDDPRLFQIDSPIQPGNSGGPLFNSQGEIIGLVVSSLNAKYFYENAGILPQNVNFAIKSTYLLNLLSMLPEGDDIIKRQNLIRPGKIEDLISQVNQFIVHIKGY